MRKKFGWYFPLSQEKIKKLWQESILTLDTNVLLDLYRYHEDTRNALLGALKKFKGRAWISYQTADEFFRNRKKVIASSINAYADAEQNLLDIRSGSKDPLNRLKSNRIIPESVAESVRTTLEAALSDAEKSIAEAKSKHPDFLERDPVLEELADLFEDAVGDPFNEDELTESSKEAKRRQDLKVPPGYLDAKKDGVRPYGDYFMWRQILDHAKKANKPIIFVTSEGKEDWWEKASGKTTGLHYELLKEAYEMTGQLLIAYRTDRFFQFSSEFSGEGANESAAAEISALVKERAARTPLLRIVSQIETEAAQNCNTGRLVIQLLRPAYAFTCSGHLEPNLLSIPNVIARLIQSPEGLPRHIIRSGTGTTFDFNVHLKSVEYEEHLPEGEYTFEYKAYVPEDISGHKAEGSEI